MENRPFDSDNLGTGEPRSSKGIRMRDMRTDERRLETHIGGPTAGARRGTRSLIRSIAAIDATAKRSIRKNDREYPIGR